MKKNLYTLPVGLPGKKNYAADVGEHEICIIGGETWLEKSAVLKVMHISDRTLRRWQKKNLLRSARIGHRLYYAESEIQSKLRESVH